MKEKNTIILMLMDLGLKRSCSILGGVMFTISAGVKGAFIYYLLTHPTCKLSGFIITIEQDGKLVGKGSGKIMLRIVSEVLFKVSSTSLQCAEQKCLYYKCLGFKEVVGHECSEFVR